MKKAIFLISALVLCLSLCACGGGNDTPNATEAPTETTAPEEVLMTKDEMLGTAKSYTSLQIFNDTSDNIAKAKQLYCGTVLEVTGCVVSIEEDHIELGLNDLPGGPVIDVYLPVDDLVLLERDQQITIVGLTGEDIEKTTQTFGGYSSETIHFKMEQAYFVKDRYEITGEICGANSDFAPAFNFAIGDDPYRKLLYFAEDVDISSISYGDILTVEGKIVYDSLGYDITEAAIIK